MGISKLCCHNSESGLNSRTPVFQRFACGVGHVMNDITRQLLFSFRLVIFMQVFGLSAANAGWLMLYGLIIVAVSSAICAFLIDNVKIPYLSKRLGRRKAWHLIGIVVGAIVTPFYFSSCFLCQSDQGQWQLMIYIAVLNTILSFSFGLIEISHLSIIPAIAKDQSEAVELNAWRTAFSFLSGIVTFIVAWLIIGQDSSDHISAENSMDFTVLTLILVGISLLFAVIFHVGTKEPSEESVGEISKNEPRKISFIPSHTLVSAMMFQGKDVNLQKQTMRDAFIDGMKAKAEGNKTGETEKQPSRKQSFPRRFIQALFSNEENDENIAGEQLPAYNKGLNESVSKRSGEIDGCSSFKPNDQGEEEMLKGVKSLPNERKISVLVSIVYGLIGVDPATDEQMNEESKMDTNSESPGNIVDKVNGIQGTNIGKGATDFTANSSVSIEHLGVDNEGYKCETELGVPASQTNTTKTVPRVTSGDLESARPVSPKPKTVRAWLNDPHLYKVAIIFTCTMSVISLAYAYLPLFLIYRVQFGKEAIAYLPLIMLISAALSSALSKKLVAIIGSKWCFVLAALFVITAGVWFYFITKSNRVMTYPATVLLGFGFSAMLVNALSFAAELIGDNKSTSGIVFAFMSLMSYVTSGTLITTIQNLFPEGSNAESCDECGDYVRHVFSFVPGSLAAISLLVVLLFHASKTICKESESQTVPRRTFVEDTRL